MELEYYKPEKQSRQKRFVCPHNREVLCSAKECINCGWHPTVAKLRMESIKEKLEGSEA